MRAIHIETNPENHGSAYAQICARRTSVECGREGKVVRKYTASNGPIKTACSCHVLPTTDFPRASDLLNKPPTQPIVELELPTDMLVLLLRQEL
jgi:hypothetical protein